MFRSAGVDVALLMINRNEDIILKEVKYLLLVLWILGLFPRLRDYDPRVCVSLRLHHFQVFIIVVGVLVSINFSFYVFFCVKNFHYFTLFSDGYQTETLNQLMELSLCVVAMTCIFYVNTLNAKEQFTILNDLLRLDRNFVKFNKKLTSTSQKYLITLVICPPFYLFLLAQTFIQWREEILFSIFTILYYSIVITVCLSQVLLIAYFLKVIINRLKILNSTLHFSRIPQTRCRELVMILALRENIHDIITKLNATYGFTSLLCIAYGAFSITGDTFYLLDTLTDPEYPFQSLIANISWLLTFFFILYHLSSTSGAMCTEVSYSNIRMCIFYSKTLTILY